jgi:hypothetical protein
MCNKRLPEDRAITCTLSTNYCIYIYQRLQGFLLSVIVNKRTNILLLFKDISDIQLSPSYKDNSLIRTEFRCLEILKIPLNFCPQERPSFFNQATFFVAEGKV